LSISFLRRIADHFDLVSTAASEGTYYRRADETVDAALAWMNTRDPESPFFLWIHLFDAHEHGANADVSIEALQRIRSPRAPAEEQRLAALGEEHELDLAALTRQIDFYDAQIAFQDAQLRRLFDDLQTRGLEDRTLWVVTADHGEGLGEHGQVGHGVHIYNEQIRVPLILYGGVGRWEPGTIDQLVRHVDLLPTIAELMGVPVDREALRVEGHSLVPLLRDPRAELPIRYTLAQIRPVDRDRPRRGIRAGEKSLTALGPRYKYIFNSHHADELYDLVADPGETKNLADQEPEALERLRSWLLAEYQELVDDARSDDKRVEMSKETIELLKKLGYL
jgi:arylsulfatase A-like enzyme